MWLIAEKLDIKYNTVKNQHGRGIYLIRKYLGVPKEVFEDNMNHFFNKIKESPMSNDSLAKLYNLNTKLIWQIKTGTQHSIGNQISTYTSALK